MGHGHVYNDVFEVLADVHRRRLLFDVLDQNPVDVSELSGVPWEIDEGDEDLVRKRHVHLPKLVDQGFVEWDREHAVVTKGPRFDEIRPFLELLDDHRDELPDGLL
jgi:hypothetical protein